MEMMMKLPSLYVGDLDATVTESQLIDTFSGIKGFVSAVLCKDAVTGLSLRYGYANFSDHQSASEAIAARNNTLMNGKAIRVMFQHENEARRRDDANLFVRNLDPSIDNTKLEAMFGKYGKILSCKIQVFDNGNSKGYGYVQFENPESAQKAIEELNGCDIEGKQIQVCHFIKKEDLVQPEVGYTNLYVKNLDQTVTEEIFRENFSVFGNITSLVISRDSNGISKGFGFVNFEKPEDAKEAKESMDGAQLGSKVLYVARAQRKEERQQMLQLHIQERRKGLNVYVKHINDDVDDDELKVYFEQCGKVNSVKIMRDKKGFSKGFGFVCFSNPQDAERAIKTLHGVLFHRKPLYVSMAQTKDERAKFLQITHLQLRNGGLYGLSNMYMIPRYPLFCFPSFPLISSFTSQNWERMNGHNLNHSIRYSYQQRAIGYQNVMNNQGVVTSEMAAFSNRYFLRF